ncbi:hypothetical protein CWE22_01000 [Pseudidiomarina aestuarii]|uniref:diguanylate cyclase n=1 Tax=Pseudidiomarina aestuarii TaxID=624146 RepID=A0A7Z7ET90_9GAMM|nr:ligand-binding sensor domain-containing diguanylate cyclase [Pseudidiomarina aestuarii]RUO40807.1 hypothetical protein CWE22_01000 [Pseudidiomarina aestuarii]
MMKRLSFSMRTVSAVVSIISIGLLSLTVHADTHLIRPLSTDASRIWNTHDGLPHNTINHIHQDAQGFLWLATWEGPVRFDGRSFEVYGAESGIPDVSTLFVTSHPVTNKVVATGGRGGVSHFDGRQWQVKPRISNRVDVVLYDSNGQTWYGTVDEGVVLERPDGTRDHFSIEQGLPSTMVLHLSIDSRDNLWVGTNRGIAVFNPYEQRFETPANLPTGISFSIEEDSLGNLWAAIDRKIYRRDLNDSQFEVLPVSFPSTITELHFDTQGRLWVGTHEHGITELRQANIDGEPLQFTNTDTGLPNNHIIDIFTDRENSLWLGTHGGLVQFRSALAHSHTQQDGLGFQFTRALAAYDSQRVLVAGLGGIALIQNERITPFAATTPVSTESILSLAVDDQQRVYIGTFTNGIFVIENEQVIAHYNESNGFRGNDVRDILLTQDGHLFATTAIGLLVAVRNDDGTLSDPQYFGAQHGLPDQVVYAVHEDQSGTIWVGSMRGISEFQRRDESHQSLVQFIDISATSNSEFVFQIREDSNYVWFATDRGLVAWSKSAESWHQLSRQHGLPFDKVFDLIIDGRGDLWLGTGRGVAFVPRDEVEAVFADKSSQVNARLYHESHGLRSAQVNTGGPSMLQANNGSIWVATARGVGHFNPKQRTSLYPPPPPVVITKVQADDRILPDGSYLTADTLRLRFEYAALGFQHNEGIRYQTRLRHFDPDWITHDNGRYTEYTELAPGDYLFEVRAAYPDGEWSEAASFSFTQIPSIWQRPFIWAIIGIIGMTLIALLVNLRLRALARSRARLSQLVKAQTRSLERLVNQDTLTHLANRRAFDLTLENAVEQQYIQHQPMALLILDVDHFKRINDQYLHTTGDKVLQRIAEVLRSTSRDSDLIARWGGEEFAVLLSGPNADAAALISERIRHAVEKADFSDLAPQLQVTISIGFAIHTRDESQANFVRRADQALYNAKANGRNRVEKAANF